MIRRPTDGSLTWNVAGLLGEDPGAERVHDVHKVLPGLGEDLRLAEPIEGRVRLIRTNRGILVQADLRAALAVECSRCLRDVTLRVDARFQEEYLPSLELSTGRPLSASEEPDVPRLNEHHELELETPVREALVLAEPIAPLCRPDCRGLCALCGERLEEGTHDHPEDDVDPRLEALRGFRAGNG